MDCKLIELLIMQHFDKTIEPADAKKLAEHVMACESCRELYLVMDESMEVAEKFDDLAKGFPPVDFTESVMNQVRELPAHSKPETAASTETGGSVVLRLLWGMSAIILGAGIWLMSLAEVPPVVDSVIYALTSVGVAIAGVFDGLAQNGGAGGNLSVVALLFVAMMGTLLFVLHNGEKSIET